MSYQTTKNQVSSLFQAVDIKQEIPPLIIGERSNPTGSKKFRELLLADDFNGCLQVGMDQEAIGAHVLDLCAAWAGRNEVEDIITLVKAYSKSIKAPLMIDSTSPEAIEAALAHYPGRAIINSVNLEDGGKTLRAVLTLAKKYGAAVVALTIDENGMAMTCKEKVAVAKRIHKIAVEEFELQSEDILFDPLTFTIASGDEKMVDAAVQTLDAIKDIKDELKGCHTVLGLSNISFGLPPAARKILNAVFLHEAVNAGMDAVIINPNNCIPLDSIDKISRVLALNLIYDKRVEDEELPLMQFIAHFEGQKSTTENNEKINISAEEKVRAAIIKGSHEGIRDTISILLDNFTPLEIINLHLVPAMREVGELFGSGEMLLPFVLKSAETMRACVDTLEPFMDKSDADSGRKILLATVQGDVHDIGKNLVNIIFSNNGYQVIDLGIKVPAEKIIEAAKEHNVDYLCLSGLLVKSAIIMQESMKLYQDNGLTQPILLGGAALTKKFVATECATNYDNQVIYCRDAFDGLRAIQEDEKGQLKTTTWQDKAETPRPEGKPKEIIASIEIPKIKQFGAKKIEVFSEDFLKLIKKNSLYRGRWSYGRGNKSKEEYAELIKSTVEPEFQKISEKVLAENLFEPKARYGWFKCQRKDNQLIVKNHDNNYEFSFPRQKRQPYLCLTDYFRTATEGEDVIGFFTCTIGKKIDAILKKLYEEDKYHDYFLLHGFSVSAGEAMAEFIHSKMRAEMGEKFNGQRYSFGYSACPDLELQKPLFKLMEAEKIGMELSDQYQMYPEISISALVVHHPQASYFAI
ncbi:MAG: dihydropteroate synthase [Desulfotalea sp.]